MLSWLAGRRSPSGAHLLTDDPLAVLTGPVDKQQTVYAVSRVNPMFKEEAWPGGARPVGEERTDWQLSAADGSTYWHEPPPDSSLQLEAALDPACAAAAATADPPDSLEPTPVSPMTARRYAEYLGVPPPPMYPDLPQLHRGPRVHVAAHGPRVPPTGRAATLPRPVWPASGAPGVEVVSEPPRRLSVSGYMTVADHIGGSWPGRHQATTINAAGGTFTLDRRATFPPARAGFAARLPSIPDEEPEPPTEGQLDSIVTESLLQLTTPRSTPAGSVRDAAREGDSQSGATTERAESFHWERGSGAGVAAGAAGAGDTFPPPPPLAQQLAPGSYGWSRAIEPLLQVLWSGDESPPVMRRKPCPHMLGMAPEDVEAAPGLAWHIAAAGAAAGAAGKLPGPPSRASSELSQLYAELAAPRPFSSSSRPLSSSRPISEDPYSWPVSPPVALAPPAVTSPLPPFPPPMRADSPPPPYLNQLLPSDASSNGGRRRSRLGSDASSQSGGGRLAVRRTPSDACSDDSRDSRLSSASGGSGGSRGSRSRLLPSDSSEGGSERRVTFSADTVDNEPGPARPRPRRRPDRSAGPSGTCSATCRGRSKGFYAANMLSRLTTGLSHKPAEKKDLEFRNFSLDVGRAAAVRREAARRWRSRHLCSAVTVVLVLVLLAAAGVLVAWLWTTERRLFRV